MIRCVCVCVAGSDQLSCEQMPLPNVYLSLTLVWALLTALWAATWASHFSSSIRLHKLLSAIPLLQVPKPEALDTPRLTYPPAHAPPYRHHPAPRPQAPIPAPTPNTKPHPPLFGGPNLKNEPATPLLQAPTLEARTRTPDPECSTRRSRQPPVPAPAATQGTGR